MEPNDLKSPRSPDDAHLEAWLRASSALPPLPDDGFSARVFAALPPPRRRLPARSLVCLVGALAGTIPAARSVLAAGNPLEHLPALDAALLHVVESLVSPSMGLAIGVTVGSLLFVFWRDLRRRVGL